MGATTTRRCRPSEVSTATAAATTCLLVGVVVGCLCAADARKSVPPPQSLVDLLLSPAYDKHALPTQDCDCATNVTISMYIEGMSTFRAHTMDFQLDMYFQQRWVDYRLRHNSSQRILINTRQLLSYLWLPDLYFANSRTSTFHDVTAANLLLWINADGSVLYDARITLTIMCMMQLAKWPLDSQQCDLRILSYSYTEDQLNVSWIEEQPIERQENITMPDMHLLGIIPGACNGTYSTGVWSCVTAKFSVKREITHHIIQSYVPTALIVVISWFSFWLDVDAVPARVSLSITTLLTLSTQANAARLALPEVSYMKAIDVWMGVCMGFVFGVMIEFTVANYAQRQNEKEGYDESDGAKPAETTTRGRVIGSINRRVSAAIKKRQSTRSRPSTTEAPPTFGNPWHRPTSPLSGDGEIDTPPPPPHGQNGLLELGTISDASDTPAVSAQTTPGQARRPLLARTESTERAVAAMSTLLLRRRPRPSADNVSEDAASPDVAAAASTGPRGWARLRNATSSPRLSRRFAYNAEKWFSTIKLVNHKRKLRGRKAAQKIDQRSRLCFPIAFGVFNIVYWIYYLFIA